jgi:N4-gp56 family major capsid protein
VANVDTSLSALVQTGWERTVQYNLFADVYFAQCAHVKPANITNPGTTLTWTFLTDYAAQTTPLTEGADPTPIAPSTASVTLTEYGATSVSTAKLRGSTFIQPLVDPQVAELLGRNAAVSFDTLARNALAAGTNVTYAGNVAARVNLAATNVMTAAKGRYVTAKLRTAAARGFGDMGTNTDTYIGFIHPDVSYDLYNETGADSWVQPSNYSAVDKRWNGVLGKIHGAMYVETPRAPLYVDAGTPSTVDVYSTIYVGKEALAKAYSMSESNPNPEVRMGPQTDSLRRNHTVGWYWFGGFARFREAELYRVESASSIGINV